MKKVNSTTITRFETECFWIDIVDDGTVLEAWLCGKSDGISELMFGYSKDQGNGRVLTQNEFLEDVEAELDYYRYAYYRKYYDGMDDED